MGDSLPSPFHTRPGAQHLSVFYFQPPLTLLFIHVVSRLLGAFVHFTTNSATILIPNPIHRIIVSYCHSHFVNVDLIVSQDLVTDIV
jgi:hypothetical protein